MLAIFLIVFCALPYIGQGASHSNWCTGRYDCGYGDRCIHRSRLCNGVRDCRRGQDELDCDMYCLNPVPMVTHTIYDRYLRPVNGRMLPVSKPVLNDVVEYTCEDGLFLTGEPPKCVENGMWSPHTLQCVVPCFGKLNPELISKYRLTCGSSCITTNECGTGMECFCDGPCFRVCVDPNITCRGAPDVRHATVNYTGSAIRKVARYSCDYGYYLAYGSGSLYCSGSGLWIGDEPICLPVKCGDPSTSIQETGGSVRFYGTHVKAVTKFRCPGDYIMLGGKNRTCLGNGKWSGPLTICDLRDRVERCPHPGVPINGRLIGDDFTIGSTVRFRCDFGYVLYGDEEQTCLWMKEWSGTGIAPTCVDSRYPHTAEDVIISAEIYFMFDVSESVLKRSKDLKYEIEFAKRLVKRMKRFKGIIHFGIMIFVTENVTMLNITESATRPKSTKQIFETLDRVYQEAACRNYEKKTRSKTAITYAMSQLEAVISWMNVLQENNENKRHVFIFTDGNYTEGYDPVSNRKRIERQFKPNIEFYSITACKSCHVENHAELLGFSSGRKGQNYIYLEDSHQLSSYLDKVTAVKFGSSQASLCEGPGRYNCGDGVCISRARLCNGVKDCRRGEDELDCAPVVCERNDEWRRENKYSCKRACSKKRSCRGDLKKCICDDECGLSCINPNSVCEDEPPTVEHAVYRNIRRTILTANGFKRLAIVDQVRPPYYLWDMITYTCERGRRLVGPLPRCGGHRRWTSDVPECVDMSCRNPVPYVRHTVYHRYSRPSNGRMLPVSNKTLPVLNDVVEYTCEDGLLLTGEPPECVENGMWSAHTLQCVDLRYPHTAGGVIINAEATEAHDIYFMFDVSESVLKRPKDVKDEIEFAKRLVTRMEGFNGKIHFGIMVFASENEWMLDITESATRPKSTKQILETLDRVYQEAARNNYEKKKRSRTAIHYALSRIEDMIAWLDIMHDENNKNKRHVFIFTDGNYTEGFDPAQKRKAIERQFKPNIEFYSVTACKNCHVAYHTELLEISSGENGENYIYIEDIYQLTSYLDKATDVIFDFAKCGQAGNVGSMKQQASLARSTGGEDAAENAWPWQVLLTHKSRTPERSLAKRKLIGGGSILNEKWILTAAHILEKNFKYPGWLKKYVVFVGIFNRPTTRYEKISSTIKMYSIGEYIPHEQYSNDEGNNFENDIALIKIGSEFDSNMQAIGVDKLTFGYYIRPICLPCTKTCLKKEQLVDEYGISLINDGMDDSQKCLKEEELLLDNDAKVVVTGFGHQNTSKMPIFRERFNPPKNLQQALLQIERKQTCEQRIEEIRIKAKLSSLKFSDNMICCKSGDPNEIIDACKGDSGGPVVREV
ncbi:uncharacterized protein LOC120329810 isoform X2 [Styela clava]